MVLVIFFHKYANFQKKLRKNKNRHNSAGEKAIMADKIFRVINL